MTLATQSGEPVEAEQIQAAATETDSVPRIEILDLVTGVKFLEKAQAPTLDDLRLKLNLRREKFGSTTGYSVARDVASELGRLGYATVGPLPKNRVSFEKKRDIPIRLTEMGGELASPFGAQDHRPSL